MLLALNNEMKDKQILDYKASRKISHLTLILRTSEDVKITATSVSKTGIVKAFLHALLALIVPLGGFLGIVRIEMTTRDSSSTFVSLNISH